MTTDQLLQHSIVVSAQESRITLSGEADLAVLDELDTALRAVELRPGQVIHIDTADLTFIDVACFRRVVEFAQEARSARATVQIDHAPRCLRLLHHWADTDEVLPLA